MVIDARLKVRRPSTLLRTVASMETEDVSMHPILQQILSKTSSNIEALEIHC